MQHFSQQSTNDYNTKETKEELKNFRVWTQKKNIISEDLISHATKDHHRIKNFTSSLCEEEKAQRITNKSHFKKTEFKHSSSAQNIHYVSNEAQKMLKSIYSKIKHIKESTDEIKQLNALYLVKTTNKYMNSPNKSADDELPNINSHKEAKNFSYINDNYRRQLNKAFMRFNPLIHLENLKMLEEVDPEIKKDIVQLKEVIEQDLKEITDQNYYRQRYEELMKKKKKMIKKEILKEEANVSLNKTKSPVDPNVSLNKTSGSSATSKNLNSLSYLQRSKMTTMSDQRRKFPQRELRMVELDNMFYSLNLLKDAMQQAKIDKSIDLATNKVEEEHDAFIEPKKQFKKIEEVLKDIQNLKIKKTHKDDEKRTKATVRRDYENYIGKLSGLKDSLLQEIDK